MKRIEFLLSMPSNNSWNGKWSGQGSRYAIVKNITDKRAAALGLTEATPQSWRHSFGDGWVACIDARVVPKGERLPKSRGFCGYDWMVTNIWLYGSIEHHEAVPS